MRTIYIINSITMSHMSEYSATHFNDALDDIAASGYKAIDIKFDMDGDVIIFAIPIL